MPWYRIWRVRRRSRFRRPGLLDGSTLNPDRVVGYDRRHAQGLYRGGITWKLQWERKNYSICVTPVGLGISRCNWLLTAPDQDLVSLVFLGAKA